MLSSITGDTTVYSIYSLVEKTFTVRFYNGSTLLATYTDVAYGSDIDYDVVPVYNGPGNAGDYLFIGWYPLPENITADTDCFAAYQFVGVHFREYMNGTMQSYVDADNLTAIAPYAFAGETSLESVSLPSLTLLPDYCFANTPALETVSLPAVLAANSNVFSYSSAMEILRLPEMTLLNSVSALVSNMSALKELRIPKLTTTPSSGAVSVCSSLELLDLGMAAAVGLQISSTYMSKLRYLILRNTTTVVTSGNAPNSSSPIGKKTDAYILVPRSMVDSYKADSFWSPYSSIIAAIEDHPEICT